jgi:hypothetical protein
VKENDMTDINIDFCRSMLRSAHEEVRKHFPGIKVSEAAVVGPSFGQYLFEFVHNGERFAEYVSADNAYEARYEGWHKFLAHHRIEGWTHD